MTKTASLICLLNDSNRCSEGAYVYRTDEPLCKHTTFSIGGPADLYVEPSTPENLKQVISASRSNGLRTVVIGRGSNLLFADAGFRGVVISTVRMNEIRSDRDNCRLSAGAGAALSSVAGEAARNSLTGLEFAGGIPGSCGGAVYMNAGAYESEISHVLYASTYYDCISESFHTLSNQEHSFSYRDSIYRSNPQWIIVSVEFSLTVGDQTEIRGKMEDLLRKRREKQPLEYPSAGSAFKRYPGRFTAQLIDEAGLKGFSIGGAQVSEKHAGFIINRGGATASDVLELVEKIRSTVFAREGICIEPEIVFVPPEDKM